MLIDLHKGSKGSTLVPLSPRAIDGPFNANIGDAIAPSATTSSSASCSSPDLRASSSPSPNAAIMLPITICWRVPKGGGGGGGVRLGLSPTAHVIFWMRREEEHRAEAERTAVSDGRDGLQKLTLTLAPTLGLGPSPKTWP